jgi:peptide/nickel transport system substrate-binding protein
MSNYWTRQQISRRSMLRGTAVGAAGLSGAVLIGCGGGDDEVDADPTAAATAAGGGTAAATATADPNAPKSGGKLVFRIGSEPRSLDPHFDVFNPVVANMTSNNMLRFTQDLSEIVPDICELPEQPDELTYIFKVNPAAHMSDIEELGGRKVTSEDIRYTIERQRSESSDSAGTFQHAYFFKDKLASIDTPDDETVVITTKDPYAPFINYIANPWSPLVAKELVEKYGDLTENAGGSGPFIFKEWQKEVRISLERNPNYWKGGGLPYVDELEFLISPDNDTAATQFIDGTFHAHSVGQSQLKRTQDARGDDTRYAVTPLQFWRQFRMSPTEKEHPYEMYAGTDDPMGAKFADIRVREGIVRAINKQTVLDLVYSGDGQITYGPILPQFTNWALKDELAGYDPARSRKLLDAAGITDGDIKGPMMWASTSPESDQIGEVIKQQLAEVGVIADLEPMELAAYYNKTYKYRYTFSHHVPLNSPEPDENLSSYFGEFSTYFRHFNPEIFELVAKQARTVDFEERQAVVKEAQEAIVMDFPIKFMFTTNVHNFYDNSLKGFDFSLDRYDQYGYETAWIDA